MLLAGRGHHAGEVVDIARRSRHGSDFFGVCGGPGDEEGEQDRQQELHATILTPYHQVSDILATPATIPATFHDFLGNGHAIEGLRMAIAAGRLPHSLILAGPQGAGKYTLALMLAMAGGVRASAARAVVDRTIAGLLLRGSAATARGLRLARTCRGRSMRRSRLARA